MLVGVNSFIMRHVSNLLIFTKGPYMLFRKVKATEESSLWDISTIFGNSYHADCSHLFKLIHL